MPHPPRPATALDADAVRDAYRRWAVVYDRVFGSVSAAGRLRAVRAVNASEGERVLELGVGTGLALPHYDRRKRITGIDLSADMLALARARTARQHLDHVERLEVGDAENTIFSSASFDIAVAMFVASVVPNPRALLAEMKRLVRPGGLLVFVNHFAAEGGVRLFIERAMAGASRTLGWHPDFALQALLPPEDFARITRAPVPPFGLFTLVTLRNGPS